MDRRSTAVTPQWRYYIGVLEPGAEAMTCPPTPTESRHVGLTPTVRFTVKIYRNGYADPPALKCHDFP